MVSGQFHTLIRHLRRVVRPPVGDGLTDAQLLERFVQGRDEAAFEVLVWRHGPMVHGVCLRVLHREHDAEDAFQATFLALVRKAGAIGKRESVASWLYKVAYRVALRARTPVAVLSLPEEPLRDPAAGGPLAELLDRELGSVLDEEVNRLPDKYRVAFVLCQLQGQTIEAAARTLGCPPGTVGTRLARARELLRRRLAARGYASAPLAARPFAAPPAALVASTIQAALLRTAEQAVAAGVISAHVADLTKGVLRTMFLTKWAQATAVLLGLSLFGVLGLLAHRTQAVEPAPAPTVQPAPCPPDQKEDPDVVLQWKFVKDRPFYQEVTTETNQAMKVMNSDVVQKHKQTFYFSWTPLQKEGDAWELAQKIEGVKMDLDVGGNKIAFDSTQARDSDGALSDFYKALVGAEFRVTLNREYKVQKVDGRDRFLEKLAASNPSLAKLPAQVLSEDALRFAAETSFAGLPAKPVRPGDSWIRKRRLDLGPLAQYQATYRYTYEGQEGKLDRITIKVESILNDKAPPEGGAGVSFKVNTGKLKCTEGAGTLLFDRAKGRSVQLELRLKLEGEVTVLIGGQDTQVELSQTQNITVKTTDTSPIKQTGPQGDSRDREIERLREENARLRRQLQAVEEALRGEKKPSE